MNSVPATAAMTQLLSDKNICSAVHRVFPDIQRILFQIQLDITTSANRDEIGPTILGLRHVHDILALFEAKGAAIQSQETKKQP